ncbi:MAG: hydantoinase B/oxoprolinase family protein [Burkholderiales bacterium]|nr:hydantoinase B/oxoprolinase family protein [Burkholderiales bacterium]
MTTLDPVDYAVISQALLAAAREMGTKLVRSAYSNIVREARDASCAILDAAGNIVAQSEMVPMQLGSMNTTLRACLARYPADTLGEDDFLVNNHPFMGGQHLQDVFLFRPIFINGELLGFAGSTAHHLDLGGGSAGLNALASDVYQEGLLLPPLKFSVSRDWNGGTFERLLAANIRVPDQTLGDFNAQFAAKAIGVERVRALCAKYGLPTVKATMAELIAYAERTLRAAIRALPDGVYRGEDAGDDIEGKGAPLWVRAQVTVRGEEIEIDFAGTCDQVARNINSPLASTESAVMSCIKGVLIGGDTPFNEGSFRPVKLKVPYGSILNPRPPAPVRARMLPCYRAYDAVMKALAQALPRPERVIASGFDNALITCLARLSNGRYRVCLETYGGGFGASAQGDGADGIAGPLSNTTNSPIEALDMNFDYFRIVGYELVPGSFGHGRRRGGLGMRRTYEMLVDDVDFSLYGDRFEVAPEGLAGGSPGTLSHAELLRDGQVVEVDLKSGARLKKGDRIVVTTSGGAGFGDARERDRELVRADLAQGVIDTDTARTVYGYEAAGEPG